MKHCNHCELPAMMNGKCYDCQLMNKELSKCCGAEMYALKTPPSRAGFLGTQIINGIVDFKCSKCWKPFISKEETKEKCKCNDNICIDDGCLACVCSCHTSKEEVDPWEEEFDKKFVSEIQGEDDNGNYYELFKQGGKYVGEVKLFIHSLLATHERRLVEQLKQICNKSKTERGLAVAIGNFIKLIQKK